MLKIIDGYKTKFAGAGGFLLGLSMIAHTLSTGFTIQGLLDGVLVSLGGLATLGIGGKLQKLTDVLKAVKV